MRRQSGPRDQDRSVFSAALERVCEGAPAVAAALVDGEGETVDYAGALTPYAVRVAAAEWQIVLAHCQRESRAFHHTEELLIRCGAGSYGLYGLSEGYALVLQLCRGAFSASHRALAQCIREVCEEAGLPLPSSVRDGALWHRVTVRETRRRPLAIHCAGLWQPLQVIGFVQSHELNPRERGFRIRLENGFETTLIREPFARWYADEAWGTLAGHADPGPSAPLPLNLSSVADPFFPS